jgi:thiol-disulfide isomerase/thioredoxin
MDPRADNHGGRVSTRKTVPARRPIRKPVSRTPAWVAPAAVVVAIALVVAAFFVVRWYTTPVTPKPLAQDTTAAVVSKITGLPASEFNAVGQGTASNLIKPIKGSALTGATGKPEVLYIGAEYCPYCAAERWALIVALGRFGTFSGLQTTTSSSTDIYPNTPTFTFRGATYTSAYIDFRAVETSDRDQRPLQTPSASEQQVLSKYDPAGSIPFVDLGNKYAMSGATFSPDLLVGASWQAIASELQDQSSAQAKAIVGSANLVTAAICKMTSDKPASVCSSPAIQDLEKKLG